VNGCAVPPLANCSQQVSFTSTAHQNSNFDKVVLRNYLKEFALSHVVVAAQVVERKLVLCCLLSSKVARLLTIVCMHN